MKRNLVQHWDVTLAIDDLIMSMTAAQMFFSMIEYNLSKESCIGVGNEAIRKKTSFLLRNTKDGYEWSTRRFRHRKDIGEPQ